jgi:signal transduction histidine kinase
MQVIFRIRGFSIVRAGRLHLTDLTLFTGKLFKNNAKNKVNFFPKSEEYEKSIPLLRTAESNPMSRTKKFIILFVFVLLGTGLLFAKPRLATRAGGLGQLSIISFVQTIRPFTGEKESAWIKIENTGPVAGFLGKDLYEPGWTIFFISLICLSLWFIFETRAYYRRIRMLSDEQVQNLKYAMHLLYSSKKVLERELRLHKLILASISHDIRTPLVFVGAAAKNVKSQLESHQHNKVLKANEMIAYTSDKMNHLVGNLGIFVETRMFGNQVQLDKTNLNQLVLDKTSMFCHMINSEQGTLAIDIPEDIFIITNSSLLGIVIHNLVDNAFKVKRANQISIFSLPLKGKQRLVIADQGPGMPEPFIDFLSSPLSSEVNPKQSGLGLVLVREICHMLGIKVLVSNLPGAHISLVFDA